MKEYKTALNKVLKMPMLSRTKLAFPHRFRYESDYTVMEGVVKYFGHSNPWPKSALQKQHKKKPRA